MNPLSIFRTVFRLIARGGWAPILVYSLHIFFIRFIHGYRLFPALDIPMHFFGGVAIAYFLLCSFADLPDDTMASRYRAVATLVFVISLTTTAAVFWEFMEFSSDALLGTSSQLGLNDTMLDLALGITGGLSIGLLGFFLGRLHD